MNGNCSEIQNKIFDYIDGLLNVREKAEFEEHIRGCEECHAEYAKLKSVITELNSLPAEPVPDGFSESILNKLSQIEESPLPARFFNFRRSFSAIAAGLLFFLLIRSGYFDNFKHIKTAYVDDTQLVMVEDENSAKEVSKAQENEIPENKVSNTESPQATASPAPANEAAAAPQRKETPNSSKNNAAAEDESSSKASDVSDEKEEIMMAAGGSQSPSAAQEMPQQESDEMYFAAKSFTPEKDETGMHYKAAEPSESMSILASPVPSSAISSSFHDTDLPFYVSIIATVEDYDSVLKIMKEKYNASVTKEGIYLELDNEQFKSAMDLLAEYGASVTQEETSEELTANKILIKAK